MLRLLKFIGRSIGYTILTALIALVLVQFWFFLHICMGRPQSVINRIHGCAP